MVRVWTLLAVGSLFGALLKGAEGAALGAILGCVFGLAWHSVRNRASRTPIAGTSRRREAVLCVPCGEVAECDLVRDDSTRRWLDVERCSLQRDGSPACPKQCLEMLNDARPVGS